MKTKELFSLVSGLSGVTRFSMLKMVHKETVLEHTGMIAIFAFVLGTRLNQIAGHEFNIELLLKKAIVHDWDESVTGDIARPTKYYSNILRNELAALEAEGIEDISSELKLAALPQLHCQAKEGAEGCLVSLCDIACAIHRCWEETLVFNNMHFTLPAQRLRKVLHRGVRELKPYLDTKMSVAQWAIIDTFVLDLNGMLNTVLQKGNGQLLGMAHAN